MRHICTALILFFLVMLTPLAALAQEGALVNLTTEVFKETQVLNEQGEKETRLVPVSSAMPGEILTFTISYRNDGDEEAGDNVLTNPVPEHMVYEGESARGEGTEMTFSVDGGQTYGAADSLTVTGEDGRERQAMPSDYTHIRWQLVEPVPAHEGGTVSFRASVK
jgi:uncharacterized repeat protein (TIGR01451 family)